MAITRFQLEQIYTGVALGITFPLRRQTSVQVGELSNAELISGIVNAGTIDKMVMPLSIKLEDEPEYWTLPIEPLLGIQGKNIIVRRTVSKTSESSDIRGTIKERWSTDDYSIQIIGELRNWDDWERYPREDVERLRYYCEAKEAILVQCPLLEIFNITQMVIESYELPFTKGEDMQAYSISAYSDHKFELLIDTL